MTNDNGTKNPPAGPDTASTTEPTPPVAQPKNRMFLNVLQLVPRLLRKDDPDEFLHSLDMVVELAPGVTIDPSQLIWHGLLGRYVYRAPNGGIVELERIERAFKSGYDDGTRPEDIPDGHHLEMGLDPSRWHEIVDYPHVLSEPYRRWQRYDPILGVMFYVYEVVDRTTKPHSPSGIWVARTLAASDFRLVDMAHGCEPSFGSAAEACTIADHAILGEVPDYRWVPSVLPMQVLHLPSMQL